MHYSESSHVSTIVCRFPYQTEVNSTWCILYLLQSVTGMGLQGSTASSGTDGLFWCQLSTSYSEALLHISDGTILRTLGWYGVMNLGFTNTHITYTKNSTTWRKNLVISVIPYGIDKSIDFSFSCSWYARFVWSLSGICYYTILYTFCFLI